MDYEITGRPNHLRNDCTVRALHVASGLDYDMCAIAIGMAGRRNNCGSHIGDWSKVFEKLGIMKFQDDIKEYRNRRVFELPAHENFIVMIRGHLFAINNGKHSDGQAAHYNLSKQIKRVWRI